MSATHALRAARRRLLRSTLDALRAGGGGEPLVVRALTDELARWQPSDWTTSDRTIRAVGLRWAWQPDVDVWPVLIQDDPVHGALGTVPVNTPDGLGLLDSLRQTGPMPEDWGPRLHDLVGEPAATELVVAGHRRWLLSDDRRYPHADAGLLLPLRLETLFDPPGAAENVQPDGRWQLSLRVIPQEPSIVRLDRHITADETAAVTAFWRTVLPTPPAPGSTLEPELLDTGEGVRAFAELSRRVGPSRAAWLAEVSEPVSRGSRTGVRLPARRPSRSEPERVVGLPDRLEVIGWTLDGAGREQRFSLGVLTGIPDPVPLPDLGSVEDTRASWLVDFAAAQRIGLAGVFGLPGGLGQDTLAGIAVAGIGEADPLGLLGDQARSGTLSAVPVGTATSSVTGATGRPGAAPDPDDVEAWRVALRERRTTRTPAWSRYDTSALGRLDLLLRPDTATTTLPAFPGSRDDGQVPLSNLLVRALWPSLWGEWLLDAYPGGDLVLAGLLWATTVHPEGPLPALRFDDQPYGLLPITHLASARPAAPPTGPAGVPTAIGDLVPAVTSILAPALATVRDTSFLARGGGRPPDLHAVPRRLRRGAVSTGFGTVDHGDARAVLSTYGVGEPELTERMDRLQRIVAEAAERLSLGLTVVPELFPAPDQLPAVPNPMPLVQPSRSTYLWRELHGDRQAGYPLQVIELIDVLDSANVLDRSLTEIFEEHLFPVPALAAGEGRLRNLPDSLLIRLLLHSCQVSRRWLSTPPAGVMGLGALQDDFTGQLLEEQLGAARAVAEMLVDPALPTEVDGSDPRTLDPTTGRPLVRLQVPGDVRVALERALGATLDTAGRRLDPWVTALAQQRWERPADGLARNPRLGAYGWVEGPFVGQPGPSGTGRLHAPSHEQVVTATVLRDRFLRHRADGLSGERGTTPWQLDLTSRGVRSAEELADDIRFGIHPREALGARVEQIVAADHPAGVGRGRVLELRRAFPMYVDDDEHHTRRQVCDGQAALTALLRVGGAGGAGGAGLSFRPGPEEEQRLRELDRALDVYADLLVAEGVTLAATRRADRAADAMDAAAGLGAPPNLTFSRTAASGRTVATTVLAVLPSVEASADDAPLRRVEPSLTAHLDQAFAADWVWRVVTAADPHATVGTVTRTELGLTPTDTIGLSADLLARLVRRRHGVSQVTITPVSDPDAASADSAVAGPTAVDTRAWLVRDLLGEEVGRVDGAALGLTSDQLDALGSDQIEDVVRAQLGLPRLDVVAPSELARCADLAATLGTRPATRHDLDPAATPGAPVLVRRRQLLRAAARTAIRSLRRAARSAADAEQVAGVRLGVSWGVLPPASATTDATVECALLGLPLPAGGAPPGPLCQAAADVLQARLDVLDARVAERASRAGVVDAGPGPAAAATAVSDLVTDLLALGCPDSRLGVLDVWSTDRLLALTGVEASAPETDLDETWLTVVAPTRADLARLESAQLSAPPGTALLGWSSAPGDPWQTATAARSRRERRDTDRRGRTAEQTPGITLAYGPPPVWSGAAVAVGIVDRFSEVVPDPARSTWAAFGFNAPAARAQQTLLVAVPPEDGQRLDAALLHELLAEARMLTVLRTAGRWAAGAFADLAPTPLLGLGSSDPAGADLEPVVRFA